jgi:TolB-like protein
MQKLGLRLYGPFSATWADGYSLEINSAKQRALLALLATAPEGKRSRSWIQDMLWSLSGPDLGRASLRRALSDLRRTMGERFDQAIGASNKEIGLLPGSFEIIGQDADGEFLEGIVIHEPGFNTWLKEKRTANSSIVVASPANAAFSDDSQLLPSIAVIPFITPQNNDPANLLGDMFAQEITRALSRSKLFGVISHLSSRQFQQVSLDLQTAKTKLGVDYLVYGTVNTYQDHLRIDADIADTRSGKICWTQDFVGSMSDFLNGSRELISSITRRVAQSVISTSIERSVSIPLPSVESHALLMTSITFMHKQRLKEFSRARVQLEELIRRHPQHSVLHAWLGKWYILSISQGWSTDAAADAAKASDCTRRALDINPICSFSLAVDGMVQNNMRRELDVALSRFEESIDVDPNNALAWLMKSRHHSFVGEGETAVECAGKACELSPLDPHKYLYDCLAATACVANNELVKALTLANTSLKANRRHASTLRVRTVTLELLGRNTEAQDAAAELLRLEPNLTVEGYLKNHPAADHSTGRDWANALMRAGVPSH